MSNEAQAEFWNGEAGRQWVELQQVMDERLRWVGEQALDALALGPGQHVLDIGCGCGDTTLAVARRVSPGGTVLGVDLSAVMLARARERAAHEGLAGVARFDRRDVATTHVGELSRATGAAPFDAAVSRFGVMFFDDPVAAFANLRGLLAPGARLAFVAWQPLAMNDWALLPLRAVEVLLPPSAPLDPSAPGPFAFGDAGRVREILSRAGWVETDVRPLVFPMCLGATREEAARTALQLGPAARAVRDADAALRARALEAVRAALASVGEPVDLAAAAWLVTAKAP